MQDRYSLTEHLFHEKYGEILAALLRSSGSEHMEFAEEAVQFAFQRALEKWLMGLPDNPGRWLDAVAKNAFLESLRRGKTEQQKFEQI